MGCGHLSAIKITGGGRGLPSDFARGPGGPTASPDGDSQGKYCSRKRVNGMERQQSDFRTQTG